MKIIYVDPQRCTGCKVCEMVCSLHHENEVNPAKSRINVMTWEHEGIDIPIVCQQCEDPPCEEICPTNAIYRDRETGALLINEETCIGCRMCISACPFGAPAVRSDTGEVIKCDLCMGEPKCVEFCEPKALQYISASKSAMLKKRAAAQKLEDLIKAIATRSAA
ncbi:MAG: 4Fe-4S dicluster domain-containing protein [Pseudomonadota bacterium]